jgi:hypothetical protein
MINRVKILSSSPPLLPLHHWNSNLTFRFKSFSSNIISFLKHTNDFNGRRTLWRRWNTMRIRRRKRRREMRSRSK